MTTTAITAVWIYALVLTLFVVALARQVGLLQTRITPTGARAVSAGPEVGVETTAIDVVAENGTSVAVSGPAELPRLLVFVAPSCPACESIRPALRGFANTESGAIDVVAVGFRGAHETNAPYFERFANSAIHCVYSPDLAEQFKVSLSPFAILIDQRGIVRATGIVNNIEHLQSVVNALVFEAPTMDAWIQKDLAVHAEGSGGREESAASGGDSQ